VDHRSETISGRVNKVIGGWRNLVSGGFRAAGTLRHVSSVVRNLVLPGGAFPPYPHLVPSDRMAA
jgi:hypothetical protein